MLPEDRNTTYTSGQPAKSPDLNALQDAVKYGQRGFNWQDVDYSRGFRQVSGSVLLQPTEGTLELQSGGGVEIDLELPQRAYLAGLRAWASGAATAELTVSLGYRQNDLTLPIDSASDDTLTSWEFVTVEFDPPITRAADSEVWVIALLGSGAFMVAVSKLQVLVAVK